ncbi:glycogen synthase [Nanobdella aerobiophila]|uniref:Glycogen synthase n=1 Tax=Nanobdella aerobiophila TaxID=2586965 RepID=A0A915S9T4_9ARCH|nr:glycogen/starch synthase [Nanobdella aerobiophila]BBL45262.1 glycogen synthase [Nanobdella aerobiophila]
MILFEESWEVCNKVGGIYTVISSKAKYIKDALNNNYFLIGPYKDNNDFIELEPLNYIKEINSSIDNIKVHYGYWDIDSKPYVFLIEFDDFLKKEKDLWKYKFWEWYKIDSLNSDFTFDEPLLWSISVGIFLEKLQNYIKDKKILHAHEWLSGGTILYIKKKNLNYKTVFTIHGTVVGRSISEKNIDVIKSLDYINADQDSYRLGVNSKHQIEKNTILNSDIFTTVSDNLKYESLKLFGRNPDYITYNYIDIKDKDIIKNYNIGKKWMDEFLTWYFYPYYDLRDDYLLFYTIGRYEIYNKGIDLYIDLLKYFNDKNLDIISFIFVPYTVENISEEILKNYRKYNELKKYIEDNEYNIIRGLYNNQYFLNPLERKNKNPEICTHKTSENTIINLLKENNLLNSKENSVKVIYAPIYLGNDILFNIEQEYLLSIFDFGFFLSRYEPYGYTPLEALNNYNPIVISNRTGFYKTLESKNIKNDFIISIDPYNIDKEYLYNKIIEYKNLDNYSKLNVKNQMYNISRLFSWKNNINEYLNIYNNL